MRTFKGLCGQLGAAARIGMVLCATHIATAQSGPEQAREYVIPILGTEQEVVLVPREEALAAVGWGEFKLESECVKLFCGPIAGDPGRQISFTL